MSRKSPTQGFHEEGDGLVQDQHEQDDTQLAVPDAESQDALEPATLASPPGRVETSNDDFRSATQNLPASPGHAEVSHNDSGSSTQEYPDGYVEARLEEEEKEAESIWELLELAPVLMEYPGARALVHPRSNTTRIIPWGIEGGYDTICVATDIEGRSNEVKIFVVAPDDQQLGFHVAYRDEFSCSLVFNPSNDDAVICNGMNHAISIIRLTQGGTSTLRPGDGKSLAPGCWVIRFEGRTIADLQILEQTAPRIMRPWSYKRPALAIEGPRKRARLSNGLPGNSAFGASVSTPPASKNALTNLKEGETIYVGQGIGAYWLTHLGIICARKNTLVLKGKHSRNGGKKDIVVKVVKSPDAIIAGRIWRREVKALSLVKGHPSIVQILGMDARFHSIEIEYINAKALDRQRNADFSFDGTVEDAKKVMRTMASALAFVHEKGYIHNDIKPANILYSAERGPILIDFGLSFPRNNPSSFGGTPWYIPPEFARNWRRRGPPSDVWALGVVVLWMLNHITLPEYGKFTSWQIADIHARTQLTPANLNARKKMKEWHDYIEDVRVKLKIDDELESLVSETLVEDTRDRIDAATLCERLDGLTLTASKRQSS